MVETENKTTQEIPAEEQRKRVKMSVKKVHIIILTAIVVLCCVYAGHQLTNSVSATIVIDSVFSADGKNPDGRKRPRNAQTDRRV